MMLCEVEFMEEGASHQISGGGLAVCIPCGLGVVTTVSVVVRWYNTGLHDGGILYGGG